ncbi:hypothetical protein DFH27DRAFT_577285 [Peziza echinospora]|nr:hypothetical protein DFH27DRAFT_577285 [Peziza echinospora]
MFLTAPPIPADGPMAVPLASFRSLAEVADAFGLSHSLMPQGDHLLSIPLPHHSTVPAALPCLMRSLEAHIANFDSRSETVYRTIVQLLLNECLIILKDGPLSCTAHTAHAGASTPQPPGHPSPLAQSIKVSGDVALRWKNGATGTEYFGRISYSVGLMATAAHLARHKMLPGTGRSGPVFPYTSFMLIAQAKHIKDAEIELCASMAVVRANRIAAQAANQNIIVGIHGLATDGLRYTFMAIDAVGNVKLARQLQLANEQDAWKIISIMLAIVEGEISNLDNAMLRSRLTNGVTSPGGRVTCGGSEVVQESNM